MLNITLVLSDMGYGSEYIDCIKSAQTGMLQCLERGQRTGRWGLDGQTISVLSDVISLHDEQIKVVTENTIMKAINEVGKRIENGDYFSTTANSIPMNNN
jgi:hypothetical protein